MSHKVNLNNVNKDVIVGSLNSLPGGFLIYRAEGDEEILYVNEALLDIFECESIEEFMELTNYSFKGIVHPDDLNAVERSINQQIHFHPGHFDQVHYRIITKSGKIKYIEDYGRRYTDPIEGPLFTVFITTQVKHDPLTGLLSRWYFLENAKVGIDTIVKSKDKPVIMSFDLKDMKGFNSKYSIDEGDKLLYAVGQILSNHFGQTHCTRFGEDHFYAYGGADGLDETIQDIIHEMNAANDGKTCPIKIGLHYYESGESITRACDKARMACDECNVIYGSAFAWYNEELSSTYERNDYILRHLDQAIAERRIQVYYQPVIRTLTGRLCSAEALARWNDPVYGLMSPGEFIPVLEANNLSYKIDILIVRLVCEHLARRLNAGEPVVPISVNFSRSDFDFCDPVRVVDTAVKEHNLPKYLINVEITESIFMESKSMIHYAIERFHEAGYEVWMDDFGSGYSSLNVLKDFAFDEIKIDMAFLNNFDERAKTVLTMAVEMAKKLGIHSLAEGVETKEQVEFLKSIGCEKIQGFYYGGANPLDKTLANLEAKHIEHESREIASFYETVGLYNIISDTSLALFLYDDTNGFKLTYANDTYMNIINFPDTYTEKEINDVMNAKTNTISNKLLNLAKKACSSKHEERTSFTLNKTYYRFSLEEIAECSLGHMLVARMDNTVYDESMKFDSKITSYLRHIIDLYDNIYYVNYTEDLLTVIVSEYANENVGKEVHNVTEFFANSPLSFIHPLERQEFREWVSKEHIKKALKEADSSYIQRIFRVKKANGNYEYVEYTILSIANHMEDAVFICAKPVADIHTHPANIDCRDNEQASMAEDILTTLLNETTLKLFWKDKDRRFRGVSKAFCDFYSFKDASAVIGKTDEDVGWHMDDAPFKSDEESVLEEGIHVERSPGQNVVDGVIHNIAAFKYPLYHDGKINGLLGYFIDVEQESDIPKMHDVSQIDPHTGLMNANGYMVTLLELDDNYRLNKEDYCVLSLDIEEFVAIQNDYGDALTNELLSDITKILKASFDFTTVLARPTGANFVVCHRGNYSNSFAKQVDTCIERINAIRTLGGMRIVIHTNYALALGSESSSLHEFVSLLQTRIATKDNSVPSNLPSMHPDNYRDMPVPYCIVRPIMSKDTNKAIDVEYVYVNQKFSEMADIPIEELIGKTCLEVLPKESMRWIEVANRAVHGEYVHDRMYGVTLKHWLRFIASPSTISGCATIVFTGIEDDLLPNEPLKSQQADEVALEVAAILHDCMDFKKAINDALKTLNSIIRSDRIYIMKIDGEEISTTYEHTYRGATNEARVRQHIKHEDTLPLSHFKDQDNVIIIDDISQIEVDAPVIYRYLDLAGVHNFLAIPLFDKTQIIGFIAVDNYPYDKRNEVKKLLLLSSYSITARIIVHDLKEEIASLSNPNE